MITINNPLTPFGESLKLLRDLADLQNGAPLEQHRKEWEETMKQVYDFLNKWKGQDLLKLDKSPVTKSVCQCCGKRSIDYINTTCEHCGTRHVNILI